MIINPSAKQQSAAMPKTLSEEMIRAGILLCIGLAWPALLHLIPTDYALGPILMPLMLPLALGAFILPSRSAVAVAWIMPFLSMSVTGMPPLVVALQLGAEGTILALTVEYLQRSDKPWWLAYGLGVLASRAGAWMISVMVLQAAPSAAFATIGQGFIGLGLAGLMLPLLLSAFTKADSPTN